MTDDVIEAAEDDQADAPDPKAEEAAREKGWRPKDEWTGDDSKWMPAPEFLEMNSRRMAQADGIAKAEIGRLEREVKELKSTIGDLGSHLKKADTRAYERARKDLEAEMRAAVADGDTEAFDRVNADIKALEKEVAEETKPEPKKDDGASPAFEAWHKDNDWYFGETAASIKMTAFADQALGPMKRKYPDLPEREFLDKIAALVKEEFPDQFENTRRKKPPAVEGAPNGGGGGGDGSMWSKVDKPGRDAFAKFVKQGLFEDKKEDREKYADDYLNG